MTRKTTLLLALALAVACAHGSPADAATFRVNLLSDPVAASCTSDHCSLREAINAANTSPGADRIELRAGKRYVLSERGAPGPDDYLHPLGPDALSIVARGQGVATVDAARVDRAFYSGRLLLILQKLRVTGGLARGTTAFPGGFGGGIAALGDVTLIRCKFTGNRSDDQGGGLLVEGFLTIRRSEIFGNESGGAGGGAGFVMGGAQLVSGGLIQDSKIYDNTSGNFGGGLLIGQVDGSVVRIERSTISGNHAELVSGVDAGGGGISIPSGRVEISQSTISDNVSDRTGGGIRASGSIAELAMVNSTIADNDAVEFGGGIDASNGPAVALESTTVVRNDADSNDDDIGRGGGLHHFNTAGFLVTNSVVALNTAAVAPDCGGSPFTSGGNNLLSDATACPGFPIASDIVSTSPLLGPLSANGGTTETVAIRPGSPAIGEAGATAPTVDQRGVTRDAQPDVGAYER
jgi:CSLREA domain-containing protein